MTDREAFEAWFKAKADTGYVQRQESIAWWAWKSATAAERERCAALCDAICDEHWSRYKGTKPNSGHPARGSYYAEGMSDGAGLCADAIRRGE